MAAINQNISLLSSSNGGSRSTTGRIPPQALEIELALLGAMLVDNSCISAVADFVDAEAFYLDAHKKIYAAIISLYQRGEPADILIVSEELRRRSELDAAGGTVYLSELTSSIASSANAENYAKIIAEKSILRFLISIASDIATRCFEESADAFQALDEAEQDVFSIAQRYLKKNYQQIKKLATETMEMLESIHGKHSGITGVPSSFTNLDNLTGGFQKSDLIIIAARPSMGKTAFAITIGRNAAVNHKVPVVVFNLEMSSEQLMLRLLCAEARVNMQAVRTGKLPEEDWPRLSKSVGKLAESPIFFDDTPALTILELRTKVRRLKADHNIGLVIIDYLQLMSSPKTMESREREISTISRSLKALAKELNIPIIALSQLNRQVEGRTDKTPMLADLRESGAIEQDADLVLFINRPEVYGTMAYNDNTSTEGTAEIILAKHRNGPIGDLRMKFIKEYARFENMDIFHTPPETYVSPSKEKDTPF
ncbi:MAG TPA: replicative DNA helicase [Candidatus Kapabacteria bacterium]|nr:replicative DNA helicase [Candidatus Kapabacteria bacterium]